MLNLSPEDIKLIAEGLKIHGLYDLKGTMVWINNAEPFNPCSPENVWRMHLELMTHYRKCGYVDTPVGETFAVYGYGGDRVSVLGDTPEDAVIQAYLEYVREK